MGVLPDWMIERDVKIVPFAPQQHRPGVISYGVTSYGYDVRVDRHFKVFTNVWGSTVDPKNFDPKSFVDVDGDFCIIPPNSFALAETVEYFEIPRDILAVCLGKCLTGDTRVVDAATGDYLSIREFVARKSARTVAWDGLSVGTAEVSLTAYHMGETLDGKSLPRKYVGMSPCFRREAGTYGKDTAGLYRIHQFDKVEQVIICRNDVEESKRLHESILQNAEAILQKLDLPYRIVKVCTGDLGQGQVAKYDIETWMPSRNSYGETHSASRFYDFQARRLNLRYRDEDGRVKICHTLNNTVIASPRVLIPILELYQNADGTVTIPMALRPYMGGRETMIRSTCG